MRTRSLLALILGLALVGGAAGAADLPGTPSQQDQPVLLTADELNHDRELDIVTARGHVEISQGGRILLADTVSYNVGQDFVTATGNVVLVEPDGQVLFSDYMEITGDLKTGTSDNMRMLLTGNARMAAAQGRRIGGNRSQLDRAVYSPCDLCKEDPTRAPLWQIKAMRVTHDEVGRNVEYEDAWLEIFGLPVLYTPYFSHPDPRVERRSGMLPPSFGSTPTLGPLARVPYYYVISPQQDVTATPMLTANEGLVMIGEHRVRFDNGEMQTNGSATRDITGAWRGHVLASGRYDLDQNWRSGYVIERASDESYMYRYDFTRTQPWLTTRPWVEGFFGRSYALVEAYSFQSLTSLVNDDQTPLVLPAAHYSYLGEPAANGSYVHLDADLLALTRQGGGADTRRTSLIGGWTLPWRSSRGELYRFDLSMRGDLYYVGDNGPANAQDTITRLVPEASAQWRYPFIRTGEQWQQVIEPLAMVAFSPTGLNPANLPNEDSLDVEFAETTLFRPNRFTGLDRVEEGARLSYGLQWGAYNQAGTRIGFLAGQSYRAEPGVFPAGSGLDDNFSDYVGRIDLHTEPLIDLLYRFRLDKDDFQPRRHELGGGFGPSWLRFNTTYMFAGESATTSGTEERDEILASVSSAFLPHWSTTLFIHYDLDAGQGLSKGVSLVYDDECFTFIGSFSQSDLSGVDYRAGTSLMLQVVFKTLGSLPITLF